MRWVLARMMGVAALLLVALWLAGPPFRRGAELRVESGKRALGHLRVPPRFEPAFGHFPGAGYMARGPGYRAVVLATTVSFEGTPVRLRFLGANDRVALEAIEQLPGRVNYLIGNDPAEWARGVSLYASLRARQIYPGVDVIWRAGISGLEYELVLSAGKALRTVRLAFEGALGLRLDPEGNLLVSWQGGQIRQGRPRVFQQGHHLEGGYRILSQREVGFEVESCDPGAELLVDPELSYSTYLGGPGDDRGYGIAVDVLGNVYVAGRAGPGESTATASRVTQIRRGDPADAFVAKFSPTGTLVYLTYLGGAAVTGTGGEDEARAIQVDASGKAWIAGWTDSLNFPVTSGAFQKLLVGGRDAFLAQLDADGANLVYSTYLGGYSNDAAFGLALAGAGDVWVAGWTDSSESFPTTPGAIRRRMNGGRDIFVANFSSSGALLYSTYFGGSRWEEAWAISADQAGNAYVAGRTWSADLPVKDALQATHGGHFAYKSMDGGASWAPMALPERAHFTVLAIDPVNPSNVYAGTSLGVFRSLDAGATWQAARTGMGTLYVDSLVIDPRDPATLYAGTEVGGAFKSPDRGQHWTPINSGLQHTYVRALAFDPFERGKLYAGTNGAFYVSTDAGGRWSKLSSDVDFAEAKLFPDPRNPGVIYAGSRNLGLIKSTDGGKSWTPINPPGTKHCCPGVAFGPLDAVTVYVGIPGSGNYKSTDGGRSWSVLGSNYPQGCGAYWLALDPHTPSTIYSAGCGLYKSTDGGNSWDFKFRDLSGADAYQVVLDPANSAILYVVSNGPSDAFVLKLDPAGRLVYSTYLGGSGEDYIHGIASDPAGNIYIVGGTRSKQFLTTPSAFQTTLAVGMDMFLTKLGPRGEVVWSTLLGGEYDEQGQAVAVSPSGEVVVAGWSYGRIPASPDAIQRANRGSRDAVIAALGPAGDKLIYFTYLGGSGLDEPWALAVDGFGNVYVAGYTASANYPTASPVQAVAGGSYDVLVAKLAGALEAGELRILTPPSLPAAVAGSAYAASLTAVGGRSPYSWALESGSLPPGVSLESATGLLSGTPTTPGSYSFTVRVTDGAQTNAWRAFSLTVEVPPRLTITTGSVLPPGGVNTPYSFTLTAAGGTPPYVWELAGGSLPPGLKFDASTGQLSGTPVVVGTYPFKVRVSDKAGGVHTKDFTLTITPPVAISGVFNAASWVAGPVAPGEIVTITGTGLGPATLVGFQVQQGQLVNRLAETRVFFDNIPAALIYVQERQVSALVPYAVAGARETRIEVECKAVRSAGVRLAVAASAPGIFTVDSTGRGPGDILNQDYTLNSATNPAQRGSIVLIYATGEGETDPQVADGWLATGQLLPRPKLPVGVRIGGAEAEVLYAGAAPGMVTGLLQVNARVPEGAPVGGSVPVLLTVGGASSQPGVTMAIK